MKKAPISPNVVRTFTDKKNPSSDFLFIEDLFSKEDLAERDRVRRFCDQEVVPIAADHWDREEPPFELLPKLKDLKIAGGTIQGYGCLGISPTVLGLTTAELARGDASFALILGVHSQLAMNTIALFGSEEQKWRWLPPMAQLDKIGAFGMTEPEHGSDVIYIDTQFHQEDNRWVLNEQKKWIGNASFADVVVIWAKNKLGQVGAFLIEKGTEGFRAEIIKGKASMRDSWPTVITLEDVRIPLKNRLPKANSFNDFNTIITQSRSLISWMALGISTSCYERALAYTKKREQFGKPIASYQLVQSKLAHMLAEITSMQLLCRRLSQLAAQHKLTVEAASLVKMQTCLRARQVAADARDLLSGNGILLENHIAKHQADLEAIFTLEGTDHMHPLIIGLAITGLSRESEVQESTIAFAVFF